MLARQAANELIPSVQPQFFLRSQSIPVNLCDRRVVVRERVVVRPVLVGPRYVVHRSGRYVYYRARYRHSRFIPLPVPAFLLIGFWFILQIFSGVASVGPNAVGAGGGVAYFAHIGGFIAGAILINLFAWNRPRRRPRTRNASGF